MMFHTFLCIECKNDKGSKRCAGCDTARFCSTDCQKRAWSKSRSHDKGKCESLSSAFMSLRGESDVEALVRRLEREASGEVCFALLMRVREILVERADAKRKAKKAAKAGNSVESSPPTRGKHEMDIDLELHEMAFRRRWPAAFVTYCACLFTWRSDCHDRVFFYERLSHNHLNLDETGEAPKEIQQAMKLCEKDISIYTVGFLPLNLLCQEAGKDPLFWARLFAIASHGPARRACGSALGDALKFIWRTALHNEALLEVLEKTPGAPLAVVLDLMEESTTALLTSDLAKKIDYGKISWTQPAVEQWLLEAVLPTMDGEKKYSFGGRTSYKQSDEGGRESGNLRMRIVSAMPFELLHAQIFCERMNQSPVVLWLRDQYDAGGPQEMLAGFLKPPEYQALDAYKDRAWGHLSWWRHIRETTKKESEQVQ